MALTRIAALAIGLLMGGWMIVDGIHVLVRGKYVGPETPGPWSVLVSHAGIDPFRMGPLFVGLGACWIVCSFGLLRSRPWARRAAVAVAVASLWYLPVGTILSLAWLALLRVDGARVSGPEPPGSGRVS
jgi:hypothetical protein